MLSCDLRVNFKESRGIWRIVRKTPEFLIKTRPSLTARFVVTIGVKVSKKSSRRNLLKRRTKGVILRNLEIFKNAPSKDYWIRLLPPANNLNKQEFIKALQRVLSLN